LNAAGKPSVWSAFLFSSPGPRLRRPVEACPPHSPLPFMHSEPLANDPGAARPCEPAPERWAAMALHSPDRALTGPGLNKRCKPIRYLFPSGHAGGIESVMIRVQVDNLSCSVYMAS
jgi:hypothetical protein